MVTAPFFHFSEHLGDFSLCKTAYGIKHESRINHC